MTSITIDNVTKNYGSGQKAIRAMRDVCLHIGEGELFFLLGPSGCGKTTLLRAIAGLHDVTSGAIRFGDRDVTHLPVEQRNTAMVFQNYALWPHMTVRQNVEFGPRMKQVPGGERRQRAEACLELVELLEMAKRRPNQLSGGQQQRVALARALAANSDCLLLDEPLSNLDAKLRLQMRTELRGLIKSSGATAVYVTHDQTEALSMADRIAVMHEGEIVQVGRPEEVYNQPANAFVADFIGEANFLDALVKTTSADTLTIETTAGVILAERPADMSLAARDSVRVCIRPEWIAISPTGASASGTSALPATIEQVVYLGGTRQYRCTLADQTSWHVSTLGEQDAPFTVGQEVLLCIAPSDVRLLTD